MEAQKDVVRICQVLIGSLILGMLAFTAFAAYMVLASKSFQTAGVPDTILFVALGGLAVSELVAYRIAVRPAVIRHAQRTVAAAPDDASRNALIGTQYQILTILVAALVEGVGLFGAVILLLTGQWPAIAAPIIAAAVLIAILPTRDRLDRFSLEVSRTE